MRFARCRTLVGSALVCLLLGCSEARKYHPADGGGGDGGRDSGGSTIVGSGGTFGGAGGIFAAPTGGAGGGGAPGISSTGGANAGSGGGGLSGIVGSGGVTGTGGAGAVGGGRSGGQSGTDDAGNSVGGAGGNGLPRCSDGSCAIDFYCNASGACAAKKTPGAICSSGKECGTGYCVDGVCCNAACDGQCQSCNSDGTCSRKTFGMPTGSKAPCSGTGTCGGYCNGTSDACFYPGTATSCGSAMCSTDLASVMFSSCDGRGSCAATRSTGCNASEYCGNAMCTAKVTNGNTCQASAQCSSGNCSTNPLTGAKFCCQASLTYCTACVDLQTDNSNCGVCGASCGANRSCQGGSCKCAGSTLPQSCGGGCGTWTFESGTAEGWVKDNEPSSSISGGANNCATNITASSSTHHDGAYALAFPSNCSSAGGATAITVPICTGSPINIAGYTMSAWVNISNAGSASLDGYAFLFFNAWSASDSTSSPVLTGDRIAVPSTWYHVETTFGTAVQADHIAIELNPGKAWAGTVFVDEVTLSPP